VPELVAPELVPTGGTPLLPVSASPPTPTPDPLEPKLGAPILPAAVPLLARPAPPVLLAPAPWAKHASGISRAPTTARAITFDVRDIVLHRQLTAPFLQLTVPDSERLGKQKGSTSMSPRPPSDEGFRRLASPCPAMTQAIGCDSPVSLRFASLARHSQRGCVGLRVAASACQLAEVRDAAAMRGKQKLTNEPFKEPAVYIVMFLLCAIFVIDAVVLAYAR